MQQWEFPATPTHLDYESGLLKALTREHLLVWPEVDPVLLHNATIMTIEDRPSFIEFLMGVFQQGGYDNFRNISDTRLVLSVFQDFKPDLVLIGMHVSQAIGGLEIIRQIRARIPAAEYLPIIGFANDWTLKNFRATLVAGATDVLREPLHPEVLLLRARNYLHTRLLYLGWQIYSQMLAKKLAVLTRELEQTREELLERLALIAEYRDDQTGEHLRRVAELAGRVALELGLPEENAKAISRAALLHDLGKVGIPDSVLLKPGKLDGLEMEMVRRHTSDGARILAGVSGPSLQLAEEVILYHHERWDGKGYAGLQGESIPLAARIVAVVDAFDAMTHTRPYKKGQSVNRAIVELRQESGKQFDPQVVEALVAVLERKQLPAQAGE